MNGQLKQVIAKADVADLAGVTAAVGLTLALVFGVCIPLAVRGRLAVARHETFVATQRRAAALTAGVRAAAAEVDRVNAASAAAPERRRAAASLNERLAALVALAGECGVSVRDLKPADATRDGKQVTVPLRVVGRGGYPGVTRLLRRINAEMSDLRIDGLHLSADGEAVFDLRRVTALPDDAVAGVSP